MNTIRITSQDGIHQYDKEGRAITTWNTKWGNWIVNKEFENFDIDWYGEDSDFPGGYTEEEYIKSHPNHAQMPDISVTWRWDTKESYRKMGGHPSGFGAAYDYYDKLHYPQICVRSWGDIECSEEQAVERFANYAKFHLHADNVQVRYNGKVIFDGKYTAKPEEVK